MIIYQHRIYRSDTINNPGVWFVFGDNMQRIGYGGQAKELRGAINAIGVATKRTPSMSPNEFYSDKPEEVAFVNADLKKVADIHRHGGIIIVPSDGIGTGLSELPQRSPKIHNMIIKFFADLGYPPPWK